MWIMKLRMLYDTLLIALLVLAGVLIWQHYLVHVDQLAEKKIENERLTKIEINTAKIAKQLEIDLSDNN